MDFYPPSPHAVPASLTRPSLCYRLQAFLVALGVFAFVVLYFTLIAVFGLIAVALVVILRHHQFDAQGAGSGAIAIMIVAFLGLTSGLVTLYFIKSLFKSPKFDDSASSRSPATRRRGCSRSSSASAPRPAPRGPRRSSSRRR